MDRRWATGALVLGASILGGIALRQGDYGTAPWMLSRSSGLVAFALLSLSVVFGLMMSSKASDGLLSRPFVFAVHQFTSLLCLVFIGVHVGALLFDGFFSYGPIEVLVPLASPYRPIWVGVGVIAAWLAAAVTASFWMRGRIGAKAWRKLHYTSFGAYLLSLLHGMTAGSDGGLVLVRLLYLGSFAAVMGLLIYRIAAARWPRQAGSARAVPAAARPRPDFRRPLARHRPGVPRGAR